MEPLGRLASLSASLVAYAVERLTRVPGEKRVHRFEDGAGNRANPFGEVLPSCVAPLAAD